MGKARKKTERGRVGAGYTVARVVNDQRNEERLKITARQRQLLRLLKIACLMNCVPFPAQAKNVGDSKARAAIAITALYQQLSDYNVNVQSVLNQIYETR